MAEEPTPWAEEADKDFLGQMRDDMQVLDASGDEIGKVDYIQMADPDAATIEPGEEESVYEGRPLFARFGEEHITDRMRQAGYFKLKAKGLFSSDKYITPDMIESVTEGTVRLKYDKGHIPNPA